MAPSGLEHRRTHNLLLISKILNQRDTASPFTLILDSLEQSGKPLLGEFIRRAKIANTRIVFVAFESLERPQDVIVVPAWKNLQNWRREVASHLAADSSTRTLLIFDSLNPLAATEPSGLPQLLSSFFGPTTSILAVYHLDVPTSAGSTASQNPYSPTPLTLLRYLATTLFTTHSLHHILTRKAARDRSRAEPNYGLEEGIEGLLRGLGANSTEGTVIEMEHRRKSGRGVREWYFLPSRQRLREKEMTTTKSTRETIILLEDHPQYGSDEGTQGEAAPEGEGESTFELGLTERQKQDREGVVLPYFDAQKGGGEGGRILYDMGSEDDFDEEEDEI